MLSYITKKKYSHTNYNYFLVIGVCFVFFFNFTYFSFGMTVPETVINGASFTPVCGPGAVYFDVPGTFPPKNCGESINFGLIDGVMFEVRDLDENTNPIPPSAFVRSILEGYGCTDPLAENYDPAVIYDDGMCTYSVIYGCTDSLATNYNSLATEDDSSCTYGGGTPTAPISAPSSVYNGAYFTPVCGTGIVYFDSPNAFAPMNCGDPVTYGNVNAIFEIRGLDSDGIVVPPTVHINSIFNRGGGIIEAIISRVYYYFPLINIFSPTKGSIFSNQVFIAYKATDENDLRGDKEKSTQGLSSKPVSIFYTDKNFDWSQGSLIDDRYKNFIVKDLSASGTYMWSTNKLTPGNLYRIIVNATDLGGYTGESISEYFGVDFTAPIFKVKSDPVLVKSGDVKISIESLEDLQNLPIVKVTQRGGKTFIVKMNGEKTLYEGVYKVIEGFDGTAKIEVEGKDLAGNIGREIISGGTFSVGVNPPPKPIIISSINKTVTYLATTSLSGTVREDTEVILLVNGTTTSIIKPDSKGNFTFNNIKLEKTINNGVNYLSIASRDVFGLISESTNIEIKYNVVPTVSITKPTNKLLISGQTEIVSKGFDENQDILLYTYQIISLSEYNSKTLSNNWTTIASNIPNGNFLYDTTEIDNGEYVIRTIVDDGNIKATSTPVTVIIKNILPYFRFENGRKTITKESDITVIGTAFVPNDLINSDYIREIFYSIDGGINWEIVKFDNTLNLISKKFSVEFNGLSEGIHSILWRVKDSNNLSGRGVYTIIVDKTAPKIPTIKNIKNNSLLTNEDDESIKKDGLQITINGNAEPQSIVRLVMSEQTLTTKTSLLGEFSFSNVTLNKGKQSIDFRVVDEAGNTSVTTTLNLTFNNPPTITFINPKPFRGLPEKAVLSWSITDIDGDTVKDVNISYRKSGESFKTLVSNTQTRGTYTWNTLGLSESNNYELRISATDSITPISSIVSFIIDRSIPTLLSFNLKKEMIDKRVNFSGEGRASDSVSGIEYVEYSIKSESDKERGPWYKGTITKGYLQKQVIFTIKYPKSLEDNSYVVYVRVVDTAGNVSGEISQSISIDRTPPRIGSFFITKNDLKLIPDQEGRVSYYKNSEFTFAVSLEKDTKFAKIKISNDDINLNKNISTGLWEATTTVDVESLQDIHITVEDDSGNITENQKIATFKSINEGSVIVDNNNNIDNVRIRVSKLNEITGQYEKINPSINGVASIIETDANGQYELVLSAGKYKLSAFKSGYKVIKKEITLDRAEIVNYQFITKKISGLEKIFSDIFNSWFY